MSASKDRKYVIVCNRHKAAVSNALLFWGHHTEDDAERRSFGGYTCQLSKCERYTRDELEKWRNGDKDNYPFLDELTDSRGVHGRRMLLQHGEVFVSLDELNELGYRVYEVMVLA